MHMQNEGTKIRLETGIMTMHAAAPMAEPTSIPLYIDGKQVQSASLVTT